MSSRPFLIPPSVSLCPSPTTPSPNPHPLALAWSPGRPLDPQQSCHALIPSITRLVCPPTDDATRHISPNYHMTRGSQVTLHLPVGTPSRPKPDHVGAQPPLPPFPHTNHTTPSKEPKGNLHLPRSTPNPTNKLPNKQKEKEGPDYRKLKRDSAPPPVSGKRGNNLAAPGFKQRSTVPSLSPLP